MPLEPGTPAFYNEKLESIIAEDRALRRQRRDTPRELDFGAYDDPPRRAMAGEEGASVAAAAAINSRPFTVADASTEDVVQVSVVYGEGDDVAPTGMTPATPFLLTVMNGSKTYLRYKIHLTNRIVLSRDLFANTTIPTDGTYTEGTAAAMVHIHLATVTITDEVMSIEQHRDGNIYLREYFVVINGVLYREYFATMTRTQVLA